MHTSLPSPSKTTLPPGFEGPEKRLFLYFQHKEPLRDGLRVFKDSTWQPILDKVACKILSSLSNRHFDSYVLSESSLFVYPDKVMLKTCGTTTLLHGVLPIIELAKTIGLTSPSIVFSRRNFLYPQLQLHPHSAFETEVASLGKLIQGGDAFILGPIRKERWHVFRSGAPAPTDVALELMMCDIPPHVCKAFYEAESGSSAKEELKRVIPGFLVDDHQFAPCGYSANGMKDQYYWTTHVTPEPHCSFISWEINRLPEEPTLLCEKILNILTPGHLSIAVNSSTTLDPSLFSKLSNYTVSYSSSSTSVGMNHLFINLQRKK